MCGKRAIRCLRKQIFSLLCSLWHSTAYPRKPVHSNELDQDGIPFSFFATIPTSFRQRTFFDIGLEVHTRETIIHGVYFEYNCIWHIRPSWFDINYCTRPYERLWLCNNLASIFLSLQRRSCLSALTVHWYESFEARYNGSRYWEKETIVDSDLTFRVIRICNVSSEA